MGCPKLAYNLITEPRKNSVLKLLTSTKSNNKTRSGKVFGYNTQEKIDEISGTGNHYTAQFWEYDPRIVTRWNRDPITYTWQSPYSINNNNPIVFTDPLGLFGSRKEAREYKKEHGLKGKIKEGKDGLFSILNKKEGTSYSRDHTLDYIPNLSGRQADGVIKFTLITPKETIAPGSGPIVDGIEAYGKSGGFKLLNGDISKYAYESTKYLRQNLIVNIKPGTITNGLVNLNKKLTKNIAKHAPIIGNLLDAKEVLDGIQADGNALGANTAIELAGVAGGSFGAWGGASAGAALGTLIFPGVGTVIGAAAGAIAGSWGGEEGAEFIMKKVTKEE